MLSQRMDNHASVSGYDRCAEGIDDDPILITPMNRLVPRVTTRLLRSLITGARTEWYHRDCLWGEMTAAREWLRTQDTVFHILYGENLYRYLGKLTKPSLRRNNALVATYHTPAWRFDELIENPEHLKQLDAIIVVSTVQKEHFAQFVGEDRVFYVPHGVDTGFFCPAPEPQRAGDKLRLITVGSHLRDFAVVERVAEHLVDEPVEFKVVCSPDRAQQLKPLPNLHPVSGLSDTELRDAYQSSHALLLPLIDATANNSLLEGIACGLPVLSTQLQGVADYTNDQCALLSPKDDADAMADNVRRLLNRSVDLCAMGAESRRLAQTFAFAALSENLWQVYETVMPGIWQ